MTVTKKLIGRLPILIGEYDSIKAYNKRQRVTLYGSEFESLIDNNSYAPATLDDSSKTVTFDEEHWRVVSNGTGAFLAGEKVDTLSFNAENPQYVYTIEDNTGKVILGIEKDGNLYFEKDIPNQIKTYILNKLRAITSSSTDGTISTLNDVKKFFIGISNSNTLQGLLDGKINISDIVDNLSTSDATKPLSANQGKALLDNINSLKDNTLITDANGSIVKQSDILKVFPPTEFVYVKVDKDDKIIYGIKRDGSLYIPTDTNLSKEIKENAYVKDNEGNIIKLSDVLGTLSNNKEMLSALLDNENHVLIYLGADNKFHNILGSIVPDITVENKLILKDAAFSDFTKKLKDTGFASVMSDQSNNDEVIIPEPTDIAYVNYTGALPTGGQTSGYLEYYDKTGNYFKKPVEGFKIQGQTSKSAPKKGYQFDCSDWTLKIGDWIAMDTFQLKSWYFDLFRGKANIAYKLFREIISDRDYEKRTPYIMANLGSYNKYDSTNPDEKLDFDGEPLLTPDGIPVMFYNNETFIGVYTINIKKRAENYAMSKKSASNIIIDPAEFGGFLNSSWDLADPTNSSVSTPWSNFEIRIPKVKNLNEESYDYDSASSPMEFALSNTDKNTKVVKAAILRFQQAYKAINSKETDEDKRAELEKYFDPDWMIDYLIWSNVIFDGDGITRNTLYGTWNAEASNTDNNYTKWYPIPYDCDQIFGNMWQGNYISTYERNESAHIMGKNYRGSNIFTLIFNLYSAELNTRYKELYDKGVITPNHIVDLLKKWVSRVGLDNYKADLKKWPETPSYRDSLINSEYWEFYDRTSDTGTAMYDANTQYTAGQYVRYQGQEMYKFKCIKDCQGRPPLTGTYKAYPTTLGFHDSIGRTYKWLLARTEFLKTSFNYK